MEKSNVEWYLLPSDIIFKKISIHQTLWYNIYVTEKYHETTLHHEDSSSWISTRYPRFFDREKKTGRAVFFVPRETLSRSRARSACLSGAAKTKFMCLEIQPRSSVKLAERKRVREREREKGPIFIGAVVQISRESALVTSRNTVGVPHRSRESLFSRDSSERTTRCLKRLYYARNFARAPY